MQYSQSSSTSNRSQYTTNGTTQQQHRRMFRGRGGATDRQNLPKFNATRQRRHNKHHHHPESAIAVTNHIDSTGNENIDTNDSDLYDDDDDNDMELYQLEIIDAFVPVVPVVDESATMSDANAFCTFAATIDDRHNDGNVSLPDNHSQEENDIIFNQTILVPLQKEVQHLTRRIQNLRQNWSKSKTGIILITTYQTNVLQASLNVILKEWKSILMKYHYRDQTSYDTNTNLNISHEHHQQAQQQQQMELLLRPVSHEIFLLIQHSIQCGPLTGSQPGYFKRCGSEVAQIVYQYLDTILMSLPTHHQHHHLTTIAAAATTTCIKPSTDNISIVPSNHRNDDNDNDDDEANKGQDNNDDDDDDEDDSSNVVNNNHWKAAMEQFSDEDDAEADDITTVRDQNDHDTTTLSQFQPKNHYIDESQSQSQQQQQQQQLPNSHSNDGRNDFPLVTCFFTAAQMKTVQKWRTNANRAAISKQLPSKSMIQHEYQARQIQKEKKRIKDRKGR